MDTLTHDVFEISIPAGYAALPGVLAIPPSAGAGTVVFAHGAGSSNASPRNRAVAARLQAAGMGTLLIDLLSPAEAAAEAAGGRLRFDIPRLAERLVAAIDWLASREPFRNQGLGLYGSSTGAAAALIAAAERLDVVRAVVCRGGRVDLAGDALRQVTAATLLIVGGADTAVLRLNRVALGALGAAEQRLEIVPGAGHLFEEPGAIERVGDLASDWFAHHLPAQG